MFKGGMGGLGGMTKMLGDLPKVQKLVQKSLEEFSNIETIEDFQGLITFTAKGDSIKSIQYSDKYLKMISEDKELAEDLMLAGINSTMSKVNDVRMTKLESDAKQSKLNPTLVKQIFNNELFSSLG